MAGSALTIVGSWLKLAGCASNALDCYGAYMRELNFFGMMKGLPLQAYMYTTRRPA